MTRMQSIAAIVTGMALCTAVSAAASPRGYVYVPVMPAPCAQPSPCAPPQLLVFDATTAGQVIAIDLPVHTRAVGVAISPDGRHVYVSNRGVEFSAGNSVSIIDARHHVRLATVTVTPSGPLAVARDDSRVFILDGTSGVNAFDTASRTVTASAAVQGLDLAASSSLDRVFVLGDLTTYAFDTRTLAPLAQVDRGTYRQRLRASRDGTRLFDAGIFPFMSGCPACGSGDIVDALTLAKRATYQFTQEVIPAAEFGASQLVTFYLGTRALIDAATGATTDARSSGMRLIVDFDVLADGTSAAVLHERGSSPNTRADTAVSIVDIASAAITSTTGTFASLPADATRLVSTPSAAQSCTYRLDQAYASFTQSGTVQLSSSSTSRPVRLTTDCAWGVTAGASWVHVSAAGGSGNATLSVTVDVNTSGSTRQTVVSIGGQFLTITQAGSTSGAAFGSFDTPQDFATGVNGALAVTGWALDDVGVAALHLYRDPVAGEPQTLIPLGDATFVEGARPDVQAFYPTLPFASRAGWGYMLLTNMLPGGGNGTYRLHAYVEDVDGHSTFLGTRTITGNNSAGTLPFGAIDTPGQGETVSGVITNWGWALTPQPANIPTDGSTIDVLIDGVVVGRPTYAFDRADIAALFRGYANTNSAVGYFTIDTRTLSNGVHTIAWVVRDSMGRAQGIGSRYFTVQNP